MAARQPANHTAAFKTPEQPEVTVVSNHQPHRAAERHPMLLLKANPHGGFTAGVPNPEDFGRTGMQGLASFSTLPEMLAWVGKNMAQPALDGA